jgi:hypothetical protein
MHRSYLCNGKRLYSLEIRGPPEQLFMSAQPSELLPVNVYYLRLTFLLIKTNRFVSEKTRFICKVLLDTE